MKRSYIVLIVKISIISLSTFSCSTLQWRESDEEIISNFNEINIPTTIDYFELDSLNIKVRVQHIKKSKRDVNIVFLHGSPSSIMAWNSYLKDSSFIKTANIHAIDRPGYGYSNFGRELPKIEPQAMVISELINHYKLDNVITIGSSYGGPLAARVAAINNRVKGVVMISPAIDPNQEKDIWSSRLTQWWLTRWLVPRGYRVAGDEKTIHAAEMATIDSEWHKVKVPIIHIHGDNDNLVPYTNINYTKEKFSNIEIITLPNTGHEIAWARPELIKPHISKIIEKVITSQL